jgi:hypothetical protein
VVKVVQDNLQRIVIDTLKAVHLCGIANPVSETTFSYLATYKQKKYFDELTSSLEIPDMFKTYLSSSVLLSICISTALELIFYDYLAMKIRKEESKISIEGINCLEYQIRSYSQIILEFTELIQSLNVAESSAACTTPKKWTLKFNVQDIEGHEGFLREVEHKNVNFITTIKTLLAEDQIKTNNFQVPLFNNQFAVFHKALKDSYDKLLPDKKYDEELNNILMSFMKSNYDLFVENIGKTLNNLSKKYLVNVKDVPANENALLEVTFKSHKTEPVLIFELFCDIIKQVLKSCSDKRGFFLILELFNQFIEKLKQSFKEEFYNEVGGTHYMKGYGKNYYECEKCSYAFKNIKYPFLYAPNSEFVDGSDKSKLYSVLYFFYS